MRLKLLRLFFLGVIAASSFPALAQEPTLTDLIQFPTTTVTGRQPSTRVTIGANGSIYGTTSLGGGTCDCGSVWNYSAIGGAKNLYNFTGTTDSKTPSALTQAPDGTMWGVTLPYKSGNGVIFRVDSSNTFQVVYSFAGGTDGAIPSGPLTLGSDGNFWGVTEKGGSGYGVVFKIAPQATATPVTVYKFGGATDGRYPQGALTQGPDGNFYGATQAGTTGTTGGIFKLTPGGTFTLLYSFASSAVGANPNGNLAFLGDGTILGTTESGGAGDDGIAFSLTTGGKFTTIQAFDGLDDGGILADGLMPFGDGNFYGVTEGDATSGNIFAISPVPAFSDYYDFDGSTANIALAVPVEGADGTFYGTAALGGTTGQYEGVFYQITPPSPLPLPVQLSFASGSVAPGSSVKLSYTVPNAASVTMQQCYLYTVGAGVATEAGQLTGTLSGTTWSGSTTLTAPTQLGTYNYAITCAGIESGYATLTTAAGKSNTTTALTASPNPVYGGANVTLTATVARSGASGTPTGTVTFYYGTLVLGTGNLNGSGAATLTASSAIVAPGNYIVHAVYGGDAADNSSTSGNVTVQTIAGVTTTTLTAAPTSVTPGATVSLSAKITTTSGSVTSGTVTFAVGTYVIHTVNVSNGTAAYSASSAGVPPGTYGVTAKYNGSNEQKPSTSPVVNVTVQ